MIAVPLILYTLRISNELEKVQNSCFSKAVDKIRDLGL